MTHLVPVLRPVLGTPFRRGDLYRRAGEVPSFHIAPARTRDARDLISGSVLGTYNSASPAMAVGPDGILYQPTANAPVIEYDPTTGACLGARIWGAVTNRIRNNTMVGAVAGTPGTLPTNWNINTRGLTQTIIGTGTANGINYIDIRLNGTTTSAGGAEIKFDGNASITGLSASQSWAQSTWVAIIGGSTSNITGARLIFNEYSAGPTYLRTATNASNILSQGASLVRVGGSITTGASTTIGEQILLLDTAGSGVAIDITLRIGLPQLEQSGTVGPVVKTTTTASSSTADVWSITGADAARIINGSEFTVYMDGYRTFTGNFPDYPSFYAISDGSNSNACPGFGIQGGQAITNSQIISGGIGQTDFVFVNLGGSQSMKIVQALATNDSQFGVNGTLTTADTSVTMPVGLNKISIGSNAANSNFGNFYIREFSIFRSRRPNSNLSSMMSS